MSAIEELLSQYREKKQITKSRKRPRGDERTYVPERSTKGKRDTDGTDPGTESGPQVLKQ